MPGEPLGLRVAVPAGAARRAAVLGRPIRHSLSPLLHRAAYAALGLDWTYEAIECGVDDLGEVLAARADWAGFSCTMPLKHVALELAAHVEAQAAAIGSANTLLPGPDGWIADNTDVAGIVAALTGSGAAAASVTVLGAGGTAQAAVAALAQLGVAECAVLVRDAPRAARLAETARRVGIGITIGDLDPAAPALTAGLVISTLPPGAADMLASRPWSAGQTLLDVVYEPWPTPIARAAAGSQAAVVSGALVLLHQAAAQVELMTGLDPPVSAMRDALRAAAPGCGA